MQAIDQDIFNLLDEQPTPSRGSVIVAKPTLADPHFKRSVVVLIDHDNEKGSMGLIVNKYTGFSLHDVLPSVDNASNVPLYLGGPVKPDMLFFLHCLTPDVIPGSLQLSKGLYLGGDYDAIKRYVGSGQPVDGLLKCILGDAGWDQGQLGGEIERVQPLAVPGRDWDHRAAWVRKVAPTPDRFPRRAGVPAKKPL